MRQVTAILLAVVGALVAVAGVILAVADHSVFDEGQVEQTTRLIVRDRDVERLLTREVTNRVLEYPELAAHRDLVEPIVASYAEDSDVKGDVVDAVMVSYDTLLNRPDEVIDLNLEEIARPLRAQAVALEPSLDDTLPAADDMLRFELLRRDDLPEVYDVIETVRVTAWALLLVGVGLIVSAIVLGPKRFAVLAVAAGVAAAATFLVVTWISTVTDDAIDGIDDTLSRRVARLATDEYLTDLNRVAIGVVIFGLVGVIVGIGGTWIANFLRPSQRGTG